MSLKDDIAKVPHWVWLGGAAGVGLLYVLGRSSANSAASTNPLGVSSTPSVTTDGTATSGGSSGAGSSDDLTSLEAYLTQLLSQGNVTPTSPSDPTQTTTPGQGNQNPNNITNPLVLAGPITSANPAINQQVDNSIQTLLGPYGGPAVSSEAPYQGLGSSWNDVIVTQFTGGGKEVNYGTAQPAPSQGQVIPPAVQNVPGGATFLYPYGYQPGQTQQGGSDLASILNQEIAAGVINKSQAAQSFANTPVAGGGGGTNPFL